MRKIMLLVLTFVLAMASVCPSVAEDNIFTTKYFSITLPDGWITDTEDLESEEGEEELGYFASPDETGLVVGAYLVYYEDLKNVALWSSDQDELQDYVEAVMADFEDDQPEYLGIVMANTIPFILIKGTDKDGDFLYADTITNGYAIEFNAYVTDYDGEVIYPLTDEHVEQLRNILSTFVPVT